MENEEFKLGEIILIESWKGSKKEGTKPRGKFRCFCGKEFEAQLYDIKTGKQVSCGCYKQHQITMLKYKDGRTNTRLFRIFQNMKSRCYNPNTNGYKNYGGRGIKICDEWLNDFVKFRDWALINGYADELTIDRKNNDGNYEPDNCRWADRSVQGLNQRRTIKNKTGYKGISLRENGKFRVIITAQGVKYNIGTFVKLRDAIIAHNKASLEYHKEHATIHKVPEE